MNSFDFHRFSCLLKNEILDNLTKVMRGSIAGIFMGLILYGFTVITAVNRNSSIIDGAVMDQFLFSVALIGWGVIFTSYVFRNLHVPLENIQYLMLPATKLEKIVVRYLVSGPLFVLYIIVCYLIFSLLIRGVLNPVMGIEVPYSTWAFEPFAGAIIYYIKVHAYFFLGAVIFDKSNLARSCIYLFSLFVFGFLIGWIVLRIKFPMYYDFWFSLSPNTELTIWTDQNNPIVWYMSGNSISYKIISTLLYIWLIFLAYFWVEDYEV